MSTIQETIRIGEEDSSFTDEVNELAGGKVLECFQCGTCSGSCFIAEAMDYTPRQIMRMVTIGLKDYALKNSAIWLCASCYSCTVRCPRGIDVKGVMSALRFIAIREGRMEHKGAKHIIQFTKSFEASGRLNEALLVMKMEGLGAVKELPRFLNMLRRGKAPSPLLKPVPGIEEIRSILKEVRSK